MMNLVARFFILSPVAQPAQAMVKEGEVPLFSGAQLALVVVGEGEISILGAPGPLPVPGAVHNYPIKSWSSVVQFGESNCCLPPSFSPPSINDDNTVIQSPIKVA
ncbi:hypothetical protein Nepgr_027318 [Nepenthes gracilis]|uniref:Uncharacterized protein n=1 Tax=Nepenthes gracilis TaxID=150966 RepID=A0AAD3T8D6_NEPGR|nr:hypothetical protein Nepgr_027318 [Nepenthes gracilis]